MFGIEHRLRKANTELIMKNIYIAAYNHINRVNVDLNQR